MPGSGGRSVETERGAHKSTCALPRRVYSCYVPPGNRRGGACPGTPAAFLLRLVGRRGLRGEHVDAQRGGLLYVRGLPAGVRARVPRSDGGFGRRDPIPI